MKKKERTDKKYKHGEAMRWFLRKRIPKPPVASSKRLVASNEEPLYTDDYLDLMLSPEEVTDIEKQLKVSPMVRIKKSTIRKGLPAILKLKEKS